MSFHKKVTATRVVLRKWWAKSFIVEAQWDGEQLWCFTGDYSSASNACIAAQALLEGEKVLQVFGNECKPR